MHRAMSATVVVVGGKLSYERAVGRDRTVARLRHRNQAIPALSSVGMAGHARQKRDGRNCAAGLVSVARRAGRRSRLARAEHDRSPISITKMNRKRPFDSEVSLDHSVNIDDHWA